MVRSVLGLTSWILCSAGSEEEVNLLQTRANEDCTRSNRCKTTTTTTQYICDDYVCPAGFFKSASGGKVCGAECTDGECCQHEETCKDHQCGAGMESKGMDDKCIGNVCTDRQCCQRTTTTTTTPSTERFREPPPKNCPIPSRPKVCHFWGEPHFTTIFNKHNSRNNFNDDRGGRINTDERDLEFHNRGIYSIAKAHGHEVQAFFCPGPEITHDGVTGHDIKYDPTSSGNAIAVKMADNTTVVMMRHPATRAQNPDKDWTNSQAMEQGSPNIVKIIVDGKEKDFKDIGTGGSHPRKDGRNYALGEKVKPGAKGETHGTDTYVSQLSTKGDESEYATSPLCVGDDSGNFLVDFSVPVLHGKWPLVYEASVTVFAKNPEYGGSKTVCGDQSMQQAINSGRRGYLTNSDYEVPLNKVIFSSQQIAELCNTCNMNNHDSSLCKTTRKNANHVAHHRSFCDDEAQYSWTQAESSCKSGGIQTNSPWFERCIIEQCASKGEGGTLMKAEMAFTAYLKRIQR